MHAPMGPTGAFYATTGAIDFGSAVGVISEKITS